MEVKSPDVCKGKYMASVKVGPKGQIVIPKEVRDMFNISPADTLILLADAEKGIAIMRYDEFFSAVDSAFGSSDIYGKLGVSDAEKFKETAKKLKKDE